MARLSKINEMNPEKLGIKMTESFSTSRVPYLCLLFDSGRFVAEQTVKSEITAVASEGF